MHRPWKECAAVALLGFAFAAYWSISHGRDINWDFLNYHLYAGFAADGSRIAQDYFPASIQSYLLGYAYMPVAWAVTREWEVVPVQLLLAAQSVPTIVACWFLACRIAPDEPGRSALAWRVGMVTIACMNAVFLAELGTSFIDAPTAALILFSIGLVLPGPRGAEGMRPLTAGALAGMACALKLTNVPMATATGVMVLLVTPDGFAACMRSAFRFAGGLLLVFSAIYGYWAVRLYEQFGNPFFPVLLNELFRSPEYFPVSVSLDRFRPLNLTEFLLRPLFMIDPVGNVHMETRAPDARYIVLVFLAAAYAWLSRSFTAEVRRTLNALLVWALAAWVAWLLSSGNGRYAVALSMAAGITCTALVRVLWGFRSGRVRALKALCVAAFAIQAASLAQGTTFRWDGRAAVTPAYFAPQVPVAVRERPHVIVNLESQSSSWLAPFVHPASTFINPTGQYLFKPGSPAGDKLRGHLRSGSPVLVSYRSRSEDRSGSQVQPIADLLGLQVRHDACHEVLMDTTLTETAPHKRIEIVQLLCPAVYSQALSDRTVQRFNARDAVFDRVEDACPKLFRPARPQTVCRTHACARNYVNTDLSLQVSGDGGIVVLGFGGAQPAYLGTSASILLGGPLRCPGRPGRYVPFSAADAVIAAPSWE